VARASIARAGLSSAVEVRLGKALETLPRLAEEGLGPFDMIFIDADKENTPGYFDWAVRLARRGTLIIVDNVVRGGAVADARSADASVQGVQAFIEAARADPRVSATAFQTVGSKGWDGIAVAVVIGA
jgi:predicted O-methyltransferase YrrM